MRNEKATLSIVSLFIVLLSSAPCAADAAFALGRDGSRSWYGFSFNHRTISEAQENALRQCMRGGPNCAIRLTFGGTCFTIVHGTLPDGRTGFNWGTRSSQGESRNAIMANCRGQGATCELKHNFCDTVGRRRTGGWTIPSNPPGGQQQAQPRPNQQQAQPQPQPQPPVVNRQPPPENNQQSNTSDSSGSEACKEFPNLC